MVASDFSVGTKTGIEGRFGKRCALCQIHPMKVHFCHILDNGPDLFRIGTIYNLISPTFSRAGARNGLLLCPTCHRFTAYSSASAPLSFIPCPEILQYLMSRLNAQDSRDVDAILRELAENPLATPEAITAQPFLDMYTIYLSSNFRRNANGIPHHQPTSYLPPSLFHDEASHSLVEVQGIVPPGTVVYRVFDAASIPLTAPPQEMEVIHLSPVSPLGTHHDGSRLYWKLPGCSAGAFLTTVFANVLSDAPAFSPEWFNTDIVSFVNSVHSTHLNRRLLSSPSLPILRSISEGSNSHFQAPEHVAPTPEAEDTAPVYTDEEIVEWTYGPHWSASDIIKLRAKVHNPKPWFQLVPPDGQPVPLAF